MIKDTRKTIVSALVLLCIITVCSLSAYASATSVTYLDWNASETKVSCVTEGNAAVGFTYFVVSDITSNSTYRHAFSYTNATNGGAVSATAGPVNVTYPSPTPLVDYYGGWTAGLFQGY